MKLALAAFTLASIVLSGSVNARPHRRECPAGHVKHHHSQSSTVVVASSTAAAPSATSTVSSVVVTPTTTSIPTSSSVAVPVQPSSTKASSSAAATPTTTTTPVSNGVKRGLAYNDAAATIPFGNQAGWAYNWDSDKSGTLGAGQMYAPMLWGTSADHTSAWSANADKAIAAGSTHLLSFNEPDLNTQANLSPADAATAWRKYMQPYAGKAKLVAPAITNGPPPSMGTGWLDSFLSECSDCKIDAIAIHIYDSASNTAYFETYIADIGKKYNKPVWVTEFGASGSVAEQQKFLQTMVPFLDNLASVERYAYFGDFAGTMVQGNSLLDLGKTYATA